VAKKCVSNKDESVRMFRSDLVEALSHVHPAVPHAIFVPVIVAMLVWSARLSVTGAPAALLLLTGLLAWTLIEYLVHRFVFHVDPRTMEEVTRIVAALAPGQPVVPALRTLKQRRYFIAHGVHHDFPNDSRRLVMPPSLSLPIALVFFCGFRLTLGEAGAPAAFAGMALGYLAYDTVHYAVHHWGLRGRAALSLQRNHFRHHYQDPDRDYGVTSPLWDIVLGTRSRAGQPTVTPAGVGG
jgi:sterol desaturase/sphingolipid hydroxylase (fatty acid hydroxylase superfamily)